MICILEGAVLVCVPDWANAAIGLRDLFAPAAYEHTCIMTAVSRAACHIVGGSPQSQLIINYARVTLPILAIQHTHVSTVEIPLPAVMVAMEFRDFTVAFR